MVIPSESREALQQCESHHYGVEEQGDPTGMLCIAQEHIGPLCSWKRRVPVRLMDTAYAFWEAADMKKRVSTEKKAMWAFS